MKITKVTVRKSEKSYAKSRVYFFPKNESVIENFCNRRTRPYNEYRRLLPSVMRKAGLDVQLSDDNKWSQYAGCKCGCSPGFILPSLFGYDIFVDVE